MNLAHDIKSTFTKIELQHSENNKEEQRKGRAQN